MNDTIAVRAEEAPKKLGVSSATFCDWRKKYKEIFPKSKRVSSKCVLYRYSDLVNFYEQLPSCEK